MHLTSLLFYKMFEFHFIATFLYSTVLVFHDIIVENNLNSLNCFGIFCRKLFKYTVREPSRVGTQTRTQDVVQRQCIA